MEQAVGNTFERSKLMTNGKVTKLTHVHNKFNQLMLTKGKQFDKIDFRSGTSDRALPLDQIIGGLLSQEISVEEIFSLLNQGFNTTRNLKLVGAHELGADEAEGKFWIWMFCVFYEA